MEKKLWDKKMIELGKRMVDQTKIMLQESEKFQLLLNELTTLVAQKRG
ncbi:hypothetical protein ES703_29960 [subsurface metagenome]